MTYDQLDALGIDHKWLAPLEETFEKYDISTPQRQACFIGQCMHESGGFKVTKENLNYSAAGLMKTWPSRFPDMDTAEKYEHNSVKIASKVYAGRMGNTTPEEAGAYIGRGLIQLTGKDNYKSASDALGEDLLANPQLIEEPRYATLTAGWYWNKKGLNQLADNQDYETMTKRINGGLIGLDDRKAKINKALTILM
jgi:putative chitinase